MKMFGTLQPWHEAESDEIAQRVRDTVDRLREIDRWRAANARRNLYRIEPAPLSRARSMWLSGADGAIAPDTMRLRLARVQVETQAADVCGRQQPRVMFLTSGAEWQTVRRAKRLQRFIDGMFSAPGPGYSSVRELAVEIFRDAGGIWGTGLVRPRALSTGIVYQRIWAHECHVDESDARHGNPWSFFLRSRMSRHEALQQWPDAARAIAEAPTVDVSDDESGFGELLELRKTVDEIVIYEAWLRGTDEAPGRYTAVLGDTVLADEPYTRPRFPVAVLRWAPPRVGFWGHSLTDEVRELEDSFNDGLMRADEDAKLRNTRDVFVFDGSVKNKDDLAANESVNIIELAGADKPPVVSQMPALDQSVFSFLMQRYQWSFEMTGTSQQLATAQRAQGISSAEGQRTVRDLGTQRQALRARAWETFFVDLAMATIDVVRAYAEKNPGYAVKWPGKRFLETIKWDDASIDDDMFTATIEPASNLPREPGGVISAVQDYFRSGLITADTAKRLLAWPDLEREQSLEQAEADYLEDLVERFLDWDGESPVRDVYEAPDGYLSDLPRALVFMGRSYYQAKRDRAPKENLDLIRRYIDELELLIERTTAPPEAPPQDVPPQGEMPMPPEGMPLA